MLKMHYVAAVDTVHNVYKVKRVVISLPSKRNPEEIGQQDVAAIMPQSG